MKSNKYIKILFFIITLFYSSCVDPYELKFCGICEESGQWVNKGNPSTPCFKTEAECKDWIKKNAQINQDCALCN